MVDMYVAGKSMSSLDFTNFLRKSLKTVSIDLMGINLIVLKKPYSS